jgi:hypothetical protein
MTEVNAITQVQWTKFRAGRWRINNITMEMNAAAEEMNLTGARMIHIKEVGDLMMAINVVPDRKEKETRRLQGVPRIML